MTSETDLQRFLARQRTLLTREREAEIERTSLLLSNCSHKLLEQKGLALGGLGVVSVQIGLGGKSLIELDRPSAYHTTPAFPPHTFRPGDLARIDEHVSTSSSAKKLGAKVNVAEGKSVDGVVYKVSDTRIVLAIDPSPNEDLDIPERCRLLKLANTVTYDRMDRALNQLERLALPNETISTSGTTSSSNPGPNALHRVLLGLSIPSHPTSISQSPPTLFFDLHLNPSQISAVRFTLHAPEVACIHGPPGTGKTRVLVEVIRQLVFSPDHRNKEIENVENRGFKRPLKILVCGASNLAVDNLLERLSASTPIPAPIQTELVKAGTTAETLPTATQLQYPPIALTRLGHPARVLAALHSRTLDAQAETCDEAALVKDVKSELENLLSALSGKAARNTGSKARGAKAGAVPTRGEGSKKAGVKKGQRLRGEERKKAWQDIRELRKEYRKREGGVVKSVLSQAQVVLATCHGAGSRQLYNIDFDVVIIDEATQALEAVCWVPVLKAKKLILAGDPMQLGPTIISAGNRKHGKSKKQTHNQATKLSEAKDAARKAEPLIKDVTRAEPRPSRGEGNDVSTSDAGESVSSSVDSSEARVTRRETLMAIKQGTGASSSTRSLLKPPRTLGTTMFDRLEAMYGGNIKRMLNVQYRMSTKIATFPSKTLYHSRLSSHASNASNLLRDLPGVSQEEEYEDVVGEGSEVVFWDTAGAEFWERSGNEVESGSSVISRDDGGSLCNENEATLVKHWVNRLMDAGVQPSQIAIITPYQAQSQILSALLPEPGLEIGTADGMQGREREAVVLSLVRSNPEGEVGFLKEKRRLNVAMTRAKRQLCVVGDSSTICRGGGSYLKKWMAWLEAEADVRFAGDGMGSNI